MTRFLLDTNVISEFRKGARCDVHVRNWFEGVADESLFLSVLVVGEIRRGVELIRRRDPVAAGRLDGWLAGLIQQFRGHILPVSEEVADMWGKLCLEQPLPPIDGFLAATALCHGCTLVTRNVEDVTRSGVRVLNPFEFGA